MVRRLVKGEISVDELYNEFAKDNTTRDAVFATIFASVPGKTKIYGNQNIGIA